MPKIDVTKTELVWPGKYNEDGALREVPRVSLPFQVIETVNESRTTRDARRPKPQAPLFEIWRGNKGKTLEDGRHLLSLRASSERPSAPANPAKAGGKPAQVRLGDCGKRAPISRHGPRYRSSS